MPASLSNKVLSYDYADPGAWERAINRWADDNERLRQSVGERRDERSTDIRHETIQFRQDAEALLGALLYGAQLHAEHQELRKAEAHIAAHLKIDP